MRVGDEQVLVKAPPPLLPVKHAPVASWESSSSGSYAWRETLPTRMLIRKKDGASMSRPSGSRPRGMAVHDDPQRAASKARLCEDG